MESTAKAPLFPIPEGSEIEEGNINSQIPPVAKRPTTRNKQLVKSHSRQSLASRGKSRIRLPSDRGGITEDDLTDLNLVLKKTESNHQQDSPKPATLPDLFKNPRHVPQRNVEGQNFSVLGQDLALPGGKNTSRETTRREARHSDNSHIISLFLKEQINDLLQVHSFGIPIEIIINVHADYVSGTTPGARGIFHCPKCLVYWQQTGKLPESCDEAAKFTRGPLIQLNLSEAAKLVEAIKSSNKFVSHSDLSKILPLLSKATTKEERKKIIDSISKKTPQVASEKVALGPSEEFDSNSTKGEEYHDKNHQVTLQLTRAMRSKFTPTFDVTIDPTSGQETSGVKIASIGLRSGDGSFYPGFFVTSNDDDTPMMSQPIGEFMFQARGRFDDDGCYHPYNKDEPNVLSDVRFPNLQQMMTSQSRGSSGSKVDLASNFHFVFQEGRDLMLNDLFTSGLLHTKPGQQCYLVGMYDSRGHFNAACCVTMDGYVIPGICDKNNKFTVFADYDEDGEIVFLPHREKPELETILLRLQHLPPCPNASEISRGVVRNWRCVREGEGIDDPMQITVFVREAGPQGGSSVEDMNVYIGGEVGPDGHLYPYGKYDADGTFLPGGPALGSATGLVRMQSSDESNEFPMQVHNYKTDREPDGGKEDSKTPKVNGREMHGTSSDQNNRSSLDNDDVTSRSTGELPARKRSSTKSPQKRTSSRSLSRRSSRNLNSQERIYNVKSDPLQKTPSIVFVQEEVKPPSRPPSSKPKQPEVLNPAVKNRTGKPSTKPGSLADTMMSPAHGESDSANMKGPSQPGNYRDTVTRASFMADKVKSKDALRLQAAARGSSTFDSSDPGRPQTEGRSGLSKRESSMMSDVGERRLNTAGRLRSQTGVDAAKSSTPATVARQREIEKKTRKEKAEVKAKYQFAAHHSSVSGGAPEQDKLTLGGTKTSRTTLSSQKTSRRSLPGADSTTSTQRLPKMKQVTGAPPGAPGIPDKTLSSRSMRRKSSSRFRKESSTVDGIPGEDGVEEKGSKMTIEEMQRMTEKMQDAGILSDDEDMDFSDLSNISSDDEDDDEKSSKRSSFFPFLDGFSILNFTENFRFSYFAVPGYIKEHNQKVRKGILKLPIITESTSKKKEKSKKKTKGSALMKRIEKLNQTGGT